MAYRNVYKTQSEFDVIQEWGDDYEGFVIGLGYTWMGDRVIMPANQNGWNPIPEHVPVDESFHTIIPERKYDTSQYAYEKSLMQDETKVNEKVIDLIVKNKGNNITEVNLGGGKQYLPTDNSEVNIVLKDTGSRYEIKITATDKSNGTTYEATYESLIDFLSAVQDSNNLPNVNDVNKEGLNLEGLAGVGFGIAEKAGEWAEKIMDNRGAYLPKQTRFSSKTLPPIIRSPFGNYQVSPKVMNGLRGAGKALGWAGAFLTAYQLYCDLQDKRYTAATARVSIVALAYGATCIPYIGWALAIGIGVADYIWGDEFYDWIDNRASELEMWWNGVRLAL